MKEVEEELEVGVMVEEEEELGHSGPVWNIFGDKQPQSSFWDPPKLNI